MFPTVRALHKSTVVLSCMLAALGVVLPSEACAQDAAENRITLRAVSWEYPHGEETHTVHGIAAEGVSFDVVGGEGRRTLRALLIPAGWNSNASHNVESLRFSIKSYPAVVSDTVFQAIDLDFGAAMVELEPEDAKRVTLLAREIRNAALAVLKDPRAKAALPVPETQESFVQEVGRFIAARQGMMEYATTDQQILEQAEPDELYAALSYFWPMIITRSVIAGAEGTEVLLLALPSEEGAENEFACVSKYLGGSNFRMLSPSNTMPDMEVNDHVVTEITRDGNEYTHDPGDPSNTDTPLIDWAEAALCAGWLEVFGEDRCEYAQASSSGDGNNSP